MQAFLNPGVAASPQHLASQMLGSPSSSSSTVWDNPLLTGGLLLLFIGGMLAYLQTMLTYIGEHLVRKFIVSVEIPEKEEAYPWLMQWLAEQPIHPLLASQNFTLSVVSQMSAASRYRREQNLEVVHKEPPKLKYYPGIGLHMAYYQGKLLWIVKGTKNDNNNNQRQNSNTAPNGFLMIATWGRTKDIIHSLVQDAMNLSLQRDKGSTIIYNVDMAYGGWKRAISRPDRSLASVILDTNLADELVADASEFLNSSEWYAALGIPYRRAYLFHGKPGCGKTSFVAALAAKLNWCVCVLTLSEKHMNDSTLNSYLVDAPQNAIILLEDVDVAFANQDRTKKKDNDNNPYTTIWGQPKQVTFSGLLNAIDGIASQQGRLFVMTTNHKEHLDPALIRPGRVDKAVHFSLASVNQIRRMFLRFYPEEEDLATKFADRIGENRVSMAMLQGFFLGYKKNPLGSYQDIQILLDQIAAEEEAERKREEERKRIEAEEAEEEKKEKERVSNENSESTSSTSTSTSSSTASAEVTASSTADTSGEMKKGKEKEVTGDDVSVVKEAEAAAAPTTDDTSTVKEPMNASAAESAATN